MNSRGIFIMTGRLLLRVLSLLASALVAVVAVSAGAAPAWSIGGRKPLYHWLPCTEAPPGQLLTVTPVGPVDPMPRTGPRYRLGVTLRVTACAEVTGDEVYGVATYYADRAHAFPSYYRDLPADRSPARAEVWVTPGARAVCLVVHDRLRVGCRAVTWDGSGAEPAVGADLPTGHPTVDRPAYLPYGVVNGPGCPVCWS
jgi:hypothetical protein